MPSEQSATNYSSQVSAEMAELDLPGQQRAQVAQPGASAWWAGFVATTPLWLGAAPFGAI